MGIIISEETYKNINKDFFAIRFIDLVAVKGKNNAIKIFEIFDADLEKFKQLKIETLNDFKKAIKGYFEHNFENSLKLFTKIHKINPDDKVTEIFMNRCEKIIKEGWNPDLRDGVNRLVNK